MQEGDVLDLRSVRVVCAGEAFQDRVLPLEEFRLEFLGEVGLFVDDVGCLCRVCLKVEKFEAGDGFFAFVDEEFVMTVDDGAGAEIVGVGDHWVTEVGKVACGFAA